MMKSRKMRWAWYVACMGEKRNACRMLLGKLEGKRPLGRHKCRWEDIEINLGEIGWGGMYWIVLA
jgi:hypothetical protein